jgi:hypothetical protein
MAKKKSSGPVLPSGFKPLSSRLDGFFIIEEGNKIQGVLLGTFKVKGKFGEKVVYRLEVTEDHSTRIMSQDTGETDAEIGSTVGVDEKGWLKSLSRVGVGQVVYIECLGKGAGEKDPWKFNVGVLEQGE